MTTDGAQNGLSGKVMGYGKAQGQDRLTAAMLSLLQKTAMRRSVQRQRAWLITLPAAIPITIGKDLIRHITIVISSIRVSYYSTGARNATTQHIPRFPLGLVGVFTVEAAPSCPANVAEQVWRSEAPIEDLRNSCIGWNLLILNLRM